MSACRGPNVPLIEIGEVAPEVLHGAQTGGDGRGPVACRNPTPDDQTVTALGRENTHGIRPGRNTTERVAEGGREIHVSERNVHALKI